VIVSKNTVLSYDDGTKRSFMPRRSQTVDLQSSTSGLGLSRPSDPVYIVQEYEEETNYMRPSDNLEIPFQMEEKPGMAGDNMWGKRDSGMSGCSETTDGSGLSGYRSSNSSLTTPVSRRISITSLRNNSSDFKCDGVPEENEEDLANLVTPLENFAETHQIPEDQWTTVMIRHIPCRYSQDELFQEVADMGLAFNFLYLPPARRSPGNLGYAFVNFVHAVHAQYFVEAFKGHAFVCQPKSKKRAVVMFAKLQGFKENVEFYSGVKVSKSKHRPFVDRRYMEDNFQETQQ
jgi:hypothetical protein